MHERIVESRRGIAWNRTLTETYERASSKILNLRELARASSTLEVRWTHDVTTRGLILRLEFDSAVKCSFEIKGSTSFYRHPQTAGNVFSEHFASHQNALVNAKVMFSHKSMPELQRT
ncbi:hypothetical protein Ae201684_012123 [Aphanomyces euteiches]|uniref:Uncharacterized protein n=1 Tax=Aphanomyces euteiches TaxID=100861 RepID=A0A6G0WSL4_9STRA|nr:hypothetical protein Ae201684_012123 [Aphanomyces euteiches]